MSLFRKPFALFLFIKYICFTYEILNFFFVLLPNTILLFRRVTFPNSYFHFVELCFWYYRIPCYQWICPMMLWVILSIISLKFIALICHLNISVSNFGPFLPALSSMIMTMFNFTPSPLILENITIKKKSSHLFVS